MAIAIDQADLGNSSSNVSASTVAFNTSATVASAGTIFLLVHFNGAATVTVAGGSLTWVQDANGADVNQHTVLFRAYAAAGLASGTTITATLSIGCTDRIISGCSFTGVANAVKEASSTDDTAGTNFTSTAVSPTSASNLVITAVTLDTNVSYTPTAPSLEAFDFGATFDYKATATYRINSSVGSYSNVGVYGASGLIIAGTGAYGAAPTGPTPLPSDDPPIGIMGRGAGW